MGNGSIKFLRLGFVIIIYILLTAVPSLGTTVTIPPAPLIGCPNAARAAFPPGEDADRDGVPDRLLYRQTDTAGNDIELWCLDHGRFGDYGLRFSRAGDGNVWIGKCCFFLGRNGWVKEINDAGVITDVRQNNTEPATGRDLHFVYDVQKNNLTVYRTQDGRRTGENKSFTPSGNWSEFGRNLSELLALAETVDSESVLIESGLKDKKIMEEALEAERIKVAELQNRLSAWQVVLGFITVLVGIAAFIIGRKWKY